MGMLEKGEAVSETAFEVVEIALEARVLVEIVASVIFVLD
jgi:hypothetical protein